MTSLMTDTYLHAYLDTGLKAIVQVERKLVEAEIEAADASTLDDVKASVEAAVQKK